MFKPVENSHYVRKYKKSGILGKGTFGIVEEWQRSDGQPGAVAIKRFNRKDDSLDRQIYLAVREAKILKDLRHDNIVRFHEHIKQDGDHCLVLELVKGSDIGRIIAVQSSTPDGLKTDAWYKKVTKFTRQLLIGLRYLHEEKHIVHFDIKPENLLVTEYEILKICDFGLSCEMGTPVVGSRNTIYYSAPELLENDMILDNLGAIDVWGVGCVVYQLLTGTPPFLPDLTKTPGALDTLPTSTEQLGRIYQSIEVLLKFLPPNQDCDQNPLPRRTESQETPFTPDMLERLKFYKEKRPESIEFLKACWELNPSERPTCSDLLKMDFFPKTNIGDNMGYRIHQNGSAATASPSR
eukprot:jgi/Botrbrau1/11286/Bobra.0038s0052.1